MGRLIAALGSCGRVMAALPEKRTEDGGGNGGVSGSGGGERAVVGDGGEEMAGIESKDEDIRRGGVPEKDKGEGKGKGAAGGKKRKGKR